MAPRAVVGNGNHIGPVAAQATSSTPVTRNTRLLCVAARHTPTPNAANNRSKTTTTAVIAARVGTPGEPSSLMVCANGL